MATQAKEVFLTPPLTIAGCRLWFDAADSSTITGTTNVTAWRDKTASLTLTGSGPTYSNVNGYPTVTFNGNQFASTTNLPYESVCTSDANFTTFIVQLTTSSSGVNGMPFTIYLTGNVRRLAVFSSGGGSGGMFVDGASQASPRLGGITQTLDTPQLLCITRKNITTMTARLNGSQVSSSDFPGTTNFTSSSSYFVYISHSTGPWSGNMYEILHYNRDISDLEIQQIEGYLAWKWGIQALLPRSHPFSSASPYQTLSVPISRSVPLKISSSSYFFPTAISGCALWFDASDLTTITQSSGTVSEWRDKSSNAYSVIQGTASNRPTYTTNLLNGLPGIQLSATTYLYQVGSSIPNFSSSPATTVYMVAKNGSTMTNWSIINTMFFIGDGGGTNRYHLSFGYGTANGLTLLANGSYIVSPSSYVVPLNSNAIIGFSSSATSNFLFYNGSNTSYYSSGALPTANNSTWFLFGDARTTINAVSDENIYEFVGFNTILTREQQQSVEGYLAWKWGLQSSLPPTHPNYTIPYVPFPFPISIPKASIRVWSPLRIAGSLLWLDGADTSSASMTLSGNSVSVWKDKSGNGYNFIQAFSSFPTLSNISTGRGLYFDLNQALYNSTIPFPKSYTIFSVANQTSLPTFYSYIMHSPYNADKIIFFGAYNATNNFATFAGPVGSWNDVNANTPTRTIATSSNTASLLCCTNNGITLIPYFNATAMDSKVGTNDTATGMFIGDTYVAGQAWLGTIGEFTIYNSVLTTAQRQQVEGYLAWKWGLRSNLPAGHPYINFPPSP